MNVWIAVNKETGSLIACTNQGDLFKACREYAKDFELEFPVSSIFSVQEVPLQGPITLDTATLVNQED